MGRLALRAVLAFLVTAAVAYLLVLAGGLLLGEILGVSQREGAYAMGLAFTIAPAVAVLSGVVAAIRAGSRATRATGQSLGAPRSAGRLLAIGALAGGAGGYALGRAIGWLWLDGLSYAAYWQASAAAFLPLVAMAAGAQIGAALVLRSRSRGPTAD
ncbi:MAG: hypothetical protein KJZ80_10445 [Hyphomicrobiaceae bacterium]|nr:hypothetical protein [Hyphomicrobiaceae bacterium]